MRVCVAGLGVNGAAALRALARRGVEAIGFDREAGPHSLGSSHGATRILRFAYYEHPLYVPLVRAALEHWQSLATDHGGSLFRRTGGLNLGPPDGPLIRGVTESVRSHDLRHEVLDAAAVRRRFPALRPPDDAVAIHEDEAGVLAADACHEALLRDAHSRGASLRWSEPITDWRETNEGVAVRTPHGEVQADALILALGPWLAAQAWGMRAGLRVERQVVFHFAAAAELPALLWEYEADRIFYAVPSPSQLKAALHHDGEIVEPDTANRAAGADDEARVRSLLRRLLPTLDAPAEDGETCLYTNTRDGHFVIDVLPGQRHIFVVSACSGHGFKFAPAVGDLAAALACGVEPGFDVSAFRATRLSGGVTA